MLYRPEVWFVFGVKRIVILDQELEETKSLFIYLKKSKDPLVTAVSAECRERLSPLRRQFEFQQRFK